MRLFLKALSRRGPSALAAGVFLGLLAPELSELARPLLSASVFFFLLGTLLRIDSAEFFAHLRQPMISLALPAAIMIGAPACALAGLRVFAPSNVVGLAVVISLTAPPSTGNAAFARMIGLSGTTALVATLVSMAATPIATPLFSLFDSQPLRPLDLTWRLTELVGGATAVTCLIRAFARRQISEHGEAIDGLTVAALLIFALAAMAGVRAQIADDPRLAAECVGAAFACNILLQALGFFLFPGSFGERVEAGLTLGNRNVGLIWAALGAQTPPLLAFYFACAQLPVYLLPRAIQALIQRRSAQRS